MIWEGIFFQLFDTLNRYCFKPLYLSEKVRWTSGWRRRMTGDVGTLLYMKIVVLSCLSLTHYIEFDCCLFVVSVCLLLFVVVCISVFSCPWLLT